MIVLERLLSTLASLALVAILMFGALEALPGDMCTAYLGKLATAEAVARCRGAHGLDQPAWERFGHWAGGVLTGDLGRALKRDESVVSIIGPRLRNTLVLALAAAAISFPLALGLGVAAGLKRDGPVDLAISATALVAMTIPDFVAATALVLVFSVWLGWVPGIVTVPPDGPILSLLPGLVLPATALALILSAHVLRMVRASVIEVAASAYVEAARLRGVGPFALVLRHVLPNALIPAIAVMALTLAGLMTGVVVIEVAFNYPGLGRLMMNAVYDRDLPLVLGVSLVLAAIYLGLGLLADLVTIAVDPRLRSALGRGR